MSKLITAKEAAALSTSTEDLDKHIDFINRQVRVASSRGFRNIEVELTDCKYTTAVKVAARLRAAGYSFKWYFDGGVNNRACFEIGWGGSQCVN